ncbi:SRC kinase signaling inhibitor 1-like isoform X3 [Physella acuta]|uniref:SRC kinase signaling inhibitor 1-like isoform X3 n=1 Tax=Physella acuta TaxID=109671 RepID=UPI0027DC1D78|nr:SRC kinase signaling inhibitor 1-like isoform X3 [Physella acuta]
MKRVQALVTGKKKQCTKLPTPAQKGAKTPPSPGPPAPGMSKTNSSSDRRENPPSSAGAISPTAKAGTKIPAAPPKKPSKEGGAVSPSAKGKTRPSPDDKSRSKVKTEPKVPKAEGKVEVVEENVVVTQPGLKEVSRACDVTRTDEKTEVAQAPAMDVSNKPGQGGAGEPVLADAKTEGRSDPTGQPDPHTSAHHNGDSEQRPAPQPIHGILKDSHGRESAYSNMHDLTVQQRPGLMKDHYGRLSQPPSRSGSTRDIIYHQGYASLPRGSTPTTPTPESAYSYGSLQRRSNTSTPTNGYYNGSTWGSLSRKADSDSGFPNSSTDRSYGSISPSPTPNYPTASHSNQTYAVIFQPQRHVTQGHAYNPSPSRSLQYYSDSDATYQRGVRAGSVPVGYESEMAVYGVVGSPHGTVRKHDSDLNVSAGAGMRVHPDDEQYRSGPGKRPTPRRHTVGAPGNQAAMRDVETERKREAFMQLLAQRYPQYADKIKGGNQSPSPEHVSKPARSRDSQRRRLVNYDPNQSGHTMEYEDLGTMSDLELPSFQRGGFMRTSLPIVRSASTSLERPLGLVFLVFGDQTKKSLLPNEITTLDTVRALFVRAFPDLTLEMLESPRKKIYILDPATNIYFQLEDLGEIKDRSVLKIHETDSNEPQKVKERQEVRGRTVQMPVARSQSRNTYPDMPVNDFIKSHSLPPQTANNYHDLMQEQRNQWEIERRSRSRTPEVADRPRSLSAGAPNRYSHSPDRMPTPERGQLNPIPENRQLSQAYQDPGNYYEPVGAPGYRSPYPNGIYESPYHSQSPIPTQQTYVARSTRAPPMAHPQRAVAPGSDTRGHNRHSLAFAPISGAAPDGGYQRTQSYRIPPPERGATDLVRSQSVTPADDTTRWSRNRIEKMEQQLATLTAWVHYQKSDGSRAPPSAGSISDSSDTFPASSASKHKGEAPPISTTPTNHVARLQGLSDIPDGFQGSSGVSSRESTPLSAQAEVTVKLGQLKSDLHVLRRQQQLNMEAMREEFMVTLSKVKKVLSAVPEAENQVNFNKRNEVTVAKYSYKNDKEQVHKELRDLEASVEELRADVLSRQCRVNASDVEGMALLLSNITKSLADLKARFPEIQSQLKSIIDAEMRVVLAEEKFLKEEPSEIEQCLKRCKKLTGTLYTLKRLASVQDHRPSQVPNMAPLASEEVTEQKNILLENIRSLVPDHEQRLQQIEAAEASRERKKKISTQQEALKFGKTLEMATKNLRPPSVTGDKISDQGPAEEENKEQQPDNHNLAAPAKPAHTAKSVLPPASSGLTTAVSTAPASNVASVKPSFSVLSSGVKPADKPTATVSAMTSGVSDSVTTTATRSTTETTPVPSIMKTMTLPLTDTTRGILMKSDTRKCSVGDSPKKTDPSIYTYQVCGPVNPVIPVPPVFKPNNASNKPADGEEKLTDNSDGTAKSENKKASVSFSELSPTIIPSMDSPVNGTGAADLATQKQAARNAFFSSMNSPPTSPNMNSPSRNSASLDPGPVVSPTGLVGKVSSGPTINLVLSGTASPKSPTSPGTFTISPPREIIFSPAKTSPSPLTSPSRGIPRLVPENKSLSFDSSDSISSQQELGKKKVPPPPPPRKGSRPTSTSGISSISSTQASDMPRFVGGILGQHRLSGGPLSSTPKPASQKPLSRFEKDIASGICANMNRPDLQGQNNTAQQMMNLASCTKPSDDIPPPPCVTIPLEREERGSSSDSNSSSSGTSMGSQQSVISVVRSSSVNIRAISKPKPDPPRRQSSLLSKFTVGHDAPDSHKLNNGNQELNGVDL